MNTPPLLSFACPIDWSKLSGSERNRYCEACGRHVQNISLLSDAERTALIARSWTERVCGSYWVRMNGEMVTPTNPLSQREKSSVRQFGAAVLSAGALALASGCVSSPSKLDSSAPTASAIQPAAAPSEDEEVVLLMGMFCFDAAHPPERHGPSGK